MPYQLTIKNKASLTHSPYFQLQSSSLLAAPPSPAHIKARSKDNQIGLLKHQLRVAREESNQYRALCKELQDQFAASMSERAQQCQSSNALVLHWESKLLQAQRVLTFLQNQLHKKDSEHSQELTQLQTRSKLNADRLASLAQELVVARSRGLLLQSQRQELHAKIKQLKGQSQLH